MPNASAHSEWERNGAIVPALTAESEKCTKPCSDEASPRIAGNKSSSVNVMVGMMIAEQVDEVRRCGRDVQEERREVEGRNQCQQQEIPARDDRAIVTPQRSRMQRL